MTIAKDNENETETADTPTGGKIIKDLEITLNEICPQIRRNYRIPDIIDGLVVENNAAKSIREFREGDIIMSVNQQSTHTLKEFIRTFSAAKKNKGPYLFKLYRRGNIFYFALRLK